jgi:hypothetical protein
MPLFYSGQTDYIAKMNVMGNNHIVTALTAVSSTGAQSRDMNLALGNVFTLNISASGIVNLTLTFSNVPTSTPMTVTLFLSTTTTFAHTVAAWPTTTRTIGTNNPPQTNGQTAIYKLHTHNGTTWYLESLGTTYTT